MTSNSKLLNHLKRHRRSAELTQQALADIVGVTRQTIISIERGRYRPSIELALELARAFGLPVEELFELTEGEDHERG
jgi:putative transcriptional regulator